MNEHEQNVTRRQTDSTEIITYLHMRMVNIVKISCSKWDNFLSDCDTNVSFVQQNIHKAGQLAKAFEHKRKGNTQSITDDQSFLHAQSEPQE